MMAPGVAAVADRPPETAGFWLRALGRVIDFVAVMTIAFMSGIFGGIFVAIFAATGSIAPGWEQRLGETTVWSFVFGAFAALVFHTLCEGIGGASPGKIILGLRVIKTDGSRCGIGAAIVRNLGWYVDGFFFGAVAYGSMSKSLLHQRLGDKWAETIVVHTRSISPEAAAIGRPLMGLGAGALAYGVLTIIHTVAGAF